MLHKDENVKRYLQHKATMLIQAIDVISENVCNDQDRDYMIEYCEKLAEQIYIRQEKLMDFNETKELTDQERIRNAKIIMNAILNKTAAFTRDRLMVVLTSGEILSTNK